MRNPAAIPCFFFIIVIVAMFVGLVVASQRQQRRQLLEQIARRFHGRVEGGNLFRLPQVRLKYQNHPALLSFTPIGKYGYQTHFTITWPDADLRCEIYPQDILSGFRRLRGVEDIHIGSPQFDAAYFISGNNPQVVRELLSPEVQQLIFQLAALENFGAGAHRGVQVKWAGGLMTVTKPFYLSSYDALAQFISVGAKLFVAALSSRAGGIEFIDVVQEADQVESQCQVCGEPLAGSLVYCSDCHTPHHRECWEYFGGCSTYACGQKTYITKTTRQNRAAATDRPRGRRRPPAS